MTQLELLRQADTLASHLHRIPVDEQPAYRAIVHTAYGRITGV